MKNTRMSRFIAGISAFAILASQVTAFAKLAFTAGDVIDGTQIGGGGMLSGFAVDSKDYASTKKSDNYGEYHEHLKWKDNLVDKGWNAEDSMNIYPVGTPDTNYAAINDPQSFNEAPYANFIGQDVEFWNGYMFVVLERTTYGSGDADTTFESVIQIWDVANGKKAHVANWDAKDIDFGNADSNMSYGIRDIEITDDNIFMLVDMCSPSYWPHSDGMTWGCGLAIFDNAISRANYDFPLPTKSVYQQQTQGNDDRLNHGIDRQWLMGARNETYNGSGFYVLGDYLVYVPAANGGSLTAGDQEDGESNENYAQGIHIVKWNDPDRDPNALIEFSHQSFQTWLGLSFPDNYRGTEAHTGEQYPDLKNFIIEDNYAYLNIVYTAPPAGGNTDSPTDTWVQYDLLYIVDVTDPTNPVLVGKTTPIRSANGTQNLNRKMTVADGYVYIGHEHWNPNDYNPYMYIIDVNNKQNPKLVNTLSLRQYINNSDQTFGADSITAVGDYVIVQLRSHWTIIFEMNEDKTRILDYCYQRYMMSWGQLSGGASRPLVYGSRIFYPSLWGNINLPEEYESEGVLFRYLNRIEVMDFSAALPKGLYVDDIRDHGDGTYTISGTVQGVEVTPALYGLVAIGVTNTNTKQTVGGIYFEDLEMEIDAQEDVAGWRYTTDESTPANITFTLNNAYEEAIPGVYENVKLNISGGDGGGEDEGGNIPDSSIATEDLYVFVDFEQDYLDYVNYFTVWGEYTGEEAETIQILAALYNSEGKLEQIQLGDPEYLMPDEPFKIEDSFFLDNDVEPEVESVLKVFIWNGTGGIRPLGQVFRQGGATFTYTLDDAARTSAGVFDADGNLIRTLWSGVEEDAGIYTKTWDARDDNGVLRQDGKYTVTVMENNVEVKVDAFVGNTSDHSNYNYIISGYANFLSDMMYVDGKVFYIYPYTEGRQSIYYFDASNPDRKAGEFGGSNICMQRAVTDGSRMYVLNAEPAVNKTFVYAFDLNSRRMYEFEGQGTWTSSFWGTQNAYCAVNLVNHGSSFQVGGIGVQKNGNMLFTSYVGEGKVYVLNKNNGSLLYSQSFNTPRALAYNDNGGLWVGYKKDDGRYIAERYNVGSNGQLTKDNSIALEHDFGYLLHLELSPDGKRIVAADGQTNQYRMYSTETGKLVWTFGSGESYEEDPTIYQDKLMLKYTSNESDLVYSEFENDNTLWIGDTGNNRAYKLNLSNGYPEIIDEIMMQAGSHSLGVDATKPTTIFSNAVEYEMDYQKSGNDAWRAVKNWKKQVEAFGIDVVTFNQFNNMITLNGQRYFSAYYNGYQRLFCFESNYIRDTGINFNDKIMLDDGTVGSILPENGRAIYRLHKITGYNNMGDPIYDNGTIVANLPDDRNEPVHTFGGMKLNMPISENNIMMTLRCVQQTGVNDRKTYHIGGVNIGNGVATDWQWKAAPEGSEHYDGNFPTDGTFEAGNGVLNSAMKIVANGENVVFQYNGEFYKSAQTNKLYFYRDNGLLVGVFGDAARQRQTNENRGLYGSEIYPGNAFDMYFIQDETNSDRAYIMQNSENGSGNYKYNVTGLDTIKEHTIELNLKSSLWEGLGYRYYAGDSNDAGNLITKSWRGTVTAEPYTSGDDFVMRYTGFIKNPNGNGNLKLSVNTKDTVTLTINGQQLFNGTGTGTPEIYLEQDMLYPFTCEIRPSASTSGNATRVVLGYYDNQGTLQTFTQEDFRTDKMPYQDPYAVTVDLLENLPFSTVLNSGEYGITRGTPGNVNGIGLNTNGSNPSFDDVRDIRFGAALMAQDGAMWPRDAWFAKNLGKPRDDMYAWEIEMDVARTGYINYGELGNPDYSTGMHIDVLDVNDRVIARFYWAKENKAYGNNQLIYQSNNLYNNNLNSELYTVPGEYENDFNTPSPLIIQGRNGNITLTYYGRSVTVPVLDSGAQWDQPLKVKVDAFYHYDNGNAREMGMSITKLNYTQYLDY